MSNRVPKRWPTTFRDTLVHSLGVGSTTTYSLPGGLPTNRDILPRYLDIEFSANGVACFQVRLYGPVSSTQEIWSSGPFLVGPIPKTRRFPWPQIPPFPSGQTGVLYALDNICYDKDPQEQHKVVVVGHTLYSLGPETENEACPAVTTTYHASSPPSSSFEVVEPLTPSFHPAPPSGI